MLIFTLIFFAFHQFFHSSYRARQGKVLEEIIKAVIRLVDDDFEVADLAKDKIELISRAFLGYNSKLDLDVVAANQNDVLAIQIRSRDDTGGTTAKGSLVDALRKMLSYEENLSGKITYLIGIWDIINSSQRQITKDKIFASLERAINVSRAEFIENIENGIALSNSVFVKMCYGLDALIVEIQSWIGKNYVLDIDFVKEQIELLKLSDDLWLSYLVSSLELENLELNRLDNITYLKKLLSEEDYETEGFVSSEQYLHLADELVQRILPKWKEKLTFLNLNSPAEMVCYMRDLILLKFIYDKIS